jgi:hypothetical protein
MKGKWDKNPTKCSFLFLFKTKQKQEIWRYREITKEAYNL